MGPDQPDGDSLLEVVRRQRACRSFTDDPVSDELVEEILTAASHAPSAENRQPWLFVVVRSDDLRRQIGAIYETAWDAGARAHSEGRLAPGLLAEVDKGARGGVASAPVIVVVCGDASKAHPLALASSIFPAIQNLLLAASAHGLGSALTTLAVVDKAQVSELLGLPEHVMPFAAVPLGWPSRTLGPPTREPVAGKTHRDFYGNPW
jgi:nitroreductase